MPSLTDLNDKLAVVDKSTGTPINDDFSIVGNEIKLHVVPEPFAGIALFALALWRKRF